MLMKLLKRTGLVDRLRGAWRAELDLAMKPLRKDLQRMSQDLEQLRVALEDTAARAELGDKASTQLKLILKLNDDQKELIDSLPALLDEDRVLKAIPPAVFFSDEDPIKQNILFPVVFGPALTMRVWNFMDEVVAGKGILPAALAKFHEPLQEHYDTIFGPEARDRANLLPRRSSGGRLMLRRPGYHLAPHRDPKRSLVTCLMYLARPGDSEAYGTQVFRVPGDTEANCKQTYYPEANGQTCELVATVPFRPNTMLAFVNSRGAHGATIPQDAPSNLERYSYQFYVAPEQEALHQLLRYLPKSRRAMWQSKDQQVTAAAG